MKTILSGIVVLALMSPAQSRPRCTDEMLCISLPKTERQIRDTARLMCELEVHDVTVRCPTPHDLAEVRKIAKKHPQVLKAPIPAVE